MDLSAFKALELRQHQLEQQMRREHPADSAEVLRVKLEMTQQELQRELAHVQLVVSEVEAIIQRRQWMDIVAFKALEQAVQQLDHKLAVLRDRKQQAAQKQQQLEQRMRKEYHADSIEALRAELEAAERELEQELAHAQTIVSELEALV